MYLHSSMAAPIGQWRSCATPTLSCCPAAVASVNCMTGACKVQHGLSGHNRHNRTDRATAPQVQCAGCQPCSMGGCAPNVLRKIFSAFWTALAAPAARTVITAVEPAANDMPSQQSLTAPHNNALLHCLHLAQCDTPLDATRHAQLQLVTWHKYRHCR